MKISVLFLCFFVSANLLAQFHKTVQVVPEGLETNEPSIAMDPKYPAFQVLGSNTSQFFISENGGLSWNAKTLSPKEGFYGDPVTYITNTGNIYLTHLSKTKGKTWPSHFDRIVFQGSIDGGKTFYSAGLGFNEGKMQDKPWLSVDESKKSKYKDRIYITWTEFDKYGSSSPSDSSRIKFSFSDDLGKTFSEPVIISDNAGDALDGDNTLEGANVAIGKKGELYCTWAGRSKIWLDISLDGGKTWGLDKEIASQPNGWNIESLQGINRANSMPFIQAGKKDKLFVIYGHSGTGTENIYSVSSEDNGLHWSSPTMVNQQALDKSTDQYMPHICKDRKTNQIYATYYSRRFSNNNIFIDVVVAPLLKKGWGPEYRVTLQSIPPPGEQVFFGDYISVAAERKNVRVAYTFFDEIRSIPSVEVALLTEKMICKPKPDKYPPVLTSVFRAKQNDVVVHAELPGSKNAIVEIYRGKTLVYKNVYETLSQPSIEEIIPKTKLGKGLFDIRIRAGKNQLQSDFFIER